jgi:hypothetical protein
MSAQSSQSTNGSTASNSASNGTTSPWSVQQPYLEQAFSGAGSALNNSSQYTPAQMALFGNMLNTGQNQAVPASSAAAGASTSAAGATGASQGLYNLANFNPASTNNTAANIAGGNAMVNGSNIPGQVAAGMTAADQAATYGQSPQIDASAAASGNINSSRDAIEHGILSSNLAQDATQMGTQLGANAFNTGVGATQATNTANMTAQQQAAANLATGGGYDVNAGTGANTGSVGQSGGLFNIAQSGASGQNTDPYQSLLSAMGIFGGTGYGSQTTGNVNTTGTNQSTTTSDPSQMSQLGAWLNMAGSIL